MGPRRGHGEVFKSASLECALQEFVSAIDATGGVMQDSGDQYVPVADEDWLDLGEAYMSACSALGKKPKIQQEVD